MNHPVYKLLDWIDINKLCWEGLSRNPNAINLLKQNLDKIDIIELLDNPNILDIIHLIDTTLLEKELNRFSKSSSTHTISNINAIELLKNHPNKICWYDLSINIYAIKILKNKYPDRIDWDLLSMNRNPEAIQLLKKNPYCISRVSCYLAMNSTDEAIQLLINNMDKITEDSWSGLAINRNPKAIQLLKDNLDKLDNYQVLSYTKNPYIIDLLKENQHLIFWDVLSDNPNIFKLDYEQMKKNFEPLAKEIIEVACHPNRIGRLMKQYNFDFEDWFN